MAGPASENWPVTIKITKIPLAILGEDVPFFLVAGSMNHEEMDTLVKDGRIPEALTASVDVHGVMALSAVHRDNSSGSRMTLLRGQLGLGVASTTR